MVKVPTNQYNGTSDLFLNTAHMELHFLLSQQSATAGPYCNHSNWSHVISHKWLILPLKCHVFTPMLCHGLKPPHKTAFQNNPDRVLHRVAQGSLTLASLSHALALSDLIDIGIGSWGRRCLHRGWMLESQWDLQCLLAAVAHLGCGGLTVLKKTTRIYWGAGWIESVSSLFSGTKVHACTSMIICVFTRTRTDT